MITSKPGINFDESLALCGYGTGGGAERGATVSGIAR